MKYAQKMLFSLIIASILGTAISSSWGRLEEIGSIDGNYVRVVVIGEYAYCIEDSSLKIVNVSVPTNPYVEGSLSLNTPYPIHVNGNYAYIIDDVPDTLNVLRIVNVSNPCDPYLINTIVPEHHWTDVSVDSTYAYLTGWCLDILDVSDPLNPIYVGSIDMLQAGSIISLQRGYAYIGFNLGWSGGLYYSIDVKDPSNPQILDSLRTFLPPTHIFTDTNYAYICTDWEGLKIVNIKDPSDLKLTGEIKTAHACGAYAKGSYVYVADGLGGLKIIDKSDPQNMIVIDSAATLGAALDVYVDEDYIYLADHNGGLRIFNFFLGIEEGENSLYHSGILYQNYPNPFKEKTTIKISSADPEVFHSLLEVYDITGKVVNIIRFEKDKEGSCVASWDGTDNRGEKVVNGIYYYRFPYVKRGKSFGSTGKMILIK
jgi:hypothetical protein